MKIRLVSTADYQSDLGRKFLAGTLNVERAITHPERALLVANGQNHYVDVVKFPEQLTILGRNVKQVQVKLTLDFRKIFRIQKVDHYLRVLYEGEDGGLRRLHVAKITSPETVALEIIEPKNGPQRVPARLDDYSDYIAAVR